MVFCETRLLICAILSIIRVQISVANDGLEKLGRFIMEGNFKGTKKVVFK